MRHRNAMGELALVTLRTPLLNKLLRFGAHHPKVSIRQNPFLCIVDGPPLGADINTAADADSGAASFHW